MKNKGPKHITTIKYTYNANLALGCSGIYNNHYHEHIPNILYTPEQSDATSNARTRQRLIRLIRVSDGLIIERKLTKNKLQ